MLRVQGESFNEYIYQFHAVQHRLFDIEIAV